MPFHEIKICPGCQKQFECKAGSIFLCQCFDMNLSAEARELIQQKYDDCLCIVCLRGFEKMALAQDLKS